MHYLIDVSNLLYKGYFSAKNIWDNYPELHFMCKKLESILSANKDNIIHMCLDGFRPKGRRLLGEKYKEGRRSEDAYNVYTGLSSFVNLLNNDRIKIYYNEELESDEIIFTLTRTLDGRKKILSSDKDIFQALNENVIIDNGNDFIITNESYKFEYADKFFGIEPIKLPLYRAITGDPSDKLAPAVSRFPHKLAAKLVNEFNYNGNLFTTDDLKILSANYSDTEKKWINKLIESYDNLILNFEIMKLNVVTDSLNEKYEYKSVEFDEFLKNKILKLNTL